MSWPAAAVSATSNEAVVSENCAGRFGAEPTTPLASLTTVSALRLLSAKLTCTFTVLPSSSVSRT